MVLLNLLEFTSILNTVLREYRFFLDRLVSQTIVFQDKVCPVIALKHSIIFTEMKVHQILIHLFLKFDFCLLFSLLSGLGILLTSRVTTCFQEFYSAFCDCLASPSTV